MPAKKKPVKKKEEESESDSSSDSDSSSEGKAPAPKKKVVAKAKPQEKKAAKEESSSDSSGSDSKAPAPKKKVTAKAKSREKKAAKEESSSSDSESDGGDKKEDKPAEEKKVFVPPPRPVFTPHTAMGDITGAQELVYCPIDGLPPDFCIHGPSWDKSKPWCLENCPQYYPELCGVSVADAQQDADKAAAKAKAKQLPGGKNNQTKAAKAEATPAVTIKKMSRGGRKCVTSIAGLETFGVSMDAAAKIFKKKFACGSSVVKDAHGGPDTVDIQGDFEEEVIEILLAEYKIPRSKVELVDGGTKKKGKA